MTVSLVILSGRASRWVLSDTQYRAMLPVQQNTNDAAITWSKEHDATVRRGPFLPGRAEASGRASRSDHIIQFGWVL
jgi:hypothetical protein